MIHSVPGVLDSPEDFDSSEDLFDAVGSVLLESLGVDGEEDQVRGVCDHLYAVLCGGGCGDDLEDGEEDADMAKLLNAPIHLASKLRDDGRDLGD